MSEIECRKKGCSRTDVELHHLIPKFMGGKDIDGRKYLWKKHHEIISFMTASIIWEFIPVEKKEKVRQEIKKRTLWWIEH